MNQPNQISRRSLISSVSTLAVAGAVMPKILIGATVEKDQIIVLNGWVLKRSETV